MGDPKDPIEAAIKASEQPVENRGQLNVTITSTGRMVMRQKTAGGRIILPHGVLPT